MAFPVELGFILLFSILGGVLAVRLRQPSVLGLILVGALVGPNALGFIRDTSLINASIEIGAILLLFTVGIEFSLQHLLNLGLRAVLIAVIKLGTVFLFSYYTSILLGLDFVTSLFIGVILSITSTVIVVKILDQKSMSKREEIPLLVAILIIEDIFGVFALTFFSSINTQVDLAPLNLFARLLISLTIMAITYILLQRILKPLIKWLVKYSTEDTITFISLGLCGGMSYLAILFNLSPSVGAFLAGNIVASLPNSRVFEKAIHPFILTFTSLFFFSIGTIVDFSSIMGSLLIVVVLFMANILVKFIAIGFGSYLFTNFSGKQAVFSGIAMLSVGEFSLLIAKEATAINLGIDLVSIIAAIIFLSSVTMAVLINHSEKIYGITAKLLPNRAREDMTLASKFLNSISWGMLKDRMVTKRMRAEWKTILNNLIAMFFLFVFVFFLWNYFGRFLASFFNIKSALYAISAFFVIAMLFPALSISRNLLNLVKDTIGFFIRIYPEEISREKKIFRNLVLLLVFFIILVISPSLFLFLPNPVLHALVIILTALVGLEVFRASSLIHFITKRHEARFNKFSRKYKLFLRKKMRNKNEAQ